MIVVGLTGGIASGKSTVSRMIEESGVPVICLDELSHEVVKPGKPALDEIRKEFGPRVIAENGELDRAALAEVVFKDTGKRKLLESIIHPKVGDEKNARIAALEKQGHKVVVVDVPLLYEVLWDRHCDLVVVVYTAREDQERRLIARDGLSAEEARLRIDAQMPIQEKKQRADLVIDNSGSEEQTLAQVRQTLDEIRAKAEPAGTRHIA